jgi:plasmid replication initiation protein
MICCLISEVKKDEKDFFIKTFELKKLNFKNDEFNNHTYLNELCQDLLSKPFLIPNSKKWVNWFSSLEVCNGVINYNFEPSLKPYLLELKENFTSYYLNNILSLSSSYSIHMYELLKQLEKVGFRKFLIEELKEILVIPNSYQFVHFKNLMEKIKEDLKKTDLKIDYELIKEGRSFKYINFKIINNDDNLNDLRVFIKFVRVNYINQLIIVGKVKNSPKSISVNGNGKLYYLDDRKEIDNKESKKIWEFLFKNQNLIQPFTKSLFD